MRTRWWRWGAITPPSILTWTDLTGVPSAPACADLVHELMPGFEALALQRVGYLETICADEPTRLVTEVYADRQRMCFLEPEHLRVPEQLRGGASAVAWTVFEDGFIVATSLMPLTQPPPKWLFPWPMRIESSRGIDFSPSPNPELAAMLAHHLDRVRRRAGVSGVPAACHDRVALLQVMLDHTTRIFRNHWHLCFWTPFALALPVAWAINRWFGEMTFPLHAWAWVLPFSVSYVYVAWPIGVLLSRWLPWPRSAPLREMMRTYGLEGEFAKENPGVR